jgi:hypothetical protein
MAMNRLYRPQSGKFGAAFARIAVCATLSVSAVARPSGGPDGNIESLKAAYIYNFSKYVTWPPSAFSSGSSPIVVGVIGDEGVQSALDAIVRDKEVGGRRFQVREGDWKSVGQCQILFVGSGEEEASSKLPKLKGKPVLIITEAPGMTRYGSIINLRVDGGKLRFEIDSDSARAAGLSISSRLLSLAKSAG